MANAVRGVLSEGVSLRGTAELCGLTLSEIRRLVRSNGDVGHQGRHAGSA